MSKKKEKKIKRLRKYSLWPQIIETFVVEVAFIVVVVFVAITEMSSVIQNLITKNSDICNKVINYVSDEWDVNQQKLSSKAQEYITNLLEYAYEDFDSICVVDNDRNVLAAFGNNTPGPEFYKYYSDKEFKENGVYFREDYFGTVTIDLENEPTVEYGEGLNVSYYMVDEEGIVKSDDEAASNSLQMYTRLFYGSNDASLSTKKYYDWASKNTARQTLWVMYKTEIEGVNVAINKIYIQKEMESGRQTFLLLIIGIVFIFIAIYEHYRLIVVIVNRRKIKKLVYTDAITGGDNKDCFVLKASKLIKKRSRRYAVVYVRMEKYRNYVTAYGLKECENLMEDFYKSLLSMIQKRKEIAAHLEKADFIMLLHYDNDDLLNIRMQSITKALNDCRSNQHLYFTVGACRIVSRSDNIEEKISNAAAAISKLENKNDAVLWFDEVMREEQVWERRVEDDMDKALENHEFQVYLQPKYSTKKEELSAAEALVRWIHPEFGFVSPGKFIPIFEKNGFIIKLDDFMLTEVSKLQAKWLEEGRKLVPISVNVSRAHFSRYDLAEHICSIVDEYKVPHEFIELELTESAFFDDKQMLIGTVKKLKEFGFKVSMDDFGAGYSSLNSLKELPLDIIKLDAQFFREIDDVKRANLIVSDTIKLAKKLGMQIVAEGIETREQVDFLADQHCDLIQGFYFAKPLPVVEFEERAYSTSEKA